MSFGGKFALLREFTVSAAYSAYRTGDAFGFMGAAETLVEDLCISPGRSKTMPGVVEDRLRGFTPCGRSSTGLRQAAERVGQRRTLVFLVSDFHCSLPEIDSSLSRLTAHAVIPVVLWDAAEYTWPSRIVWTRIQDLETGRQRGQPFDADRVSNYFASGEGWPDIAAGHGTGL